MILIKFPLPLIEFGPSLWAWVTFIFQVSWALFKQSSLFHEKSSPKLETPEEFHRKPPVVTHFTSADGVCPFCPVDSDECGHTGTDLASPNFISSGSEISSNTEEAGNTRGTTILATRYNANDSENANTSPSNSAIPEDESPHVSHIQPVAKHEREPLAQGSIRYSSNHLKTVHFPLHPPKFGKKLHKINDENSSRRQYVTSPYKRVKWSSPSSKSGHCQKGDESDSSTSSKLPTVTYSSIQQQHSSFSSRGLKRKRSQAHLKSRIPLKILNTTAAVAALSSRSRIR